MKRVTGFLLGAMVYSLHMLQNTSGLFLHDVLAEAISFPYKTKISTN